jgi:1,3-beta-glucanosyltransferase GAS1
MYEWCGNSTYETSGYEARTEEFSNYSVPLFFSEYGCNVPSPRIFTEVLALYSSPMTDVWSGGIVYEWFEETNDYGLVTQIGSSVSPLPDYTALSRQLALISPTQVASSAYTPSNSAPSCPSPTQGVWDAATSLPPTPNEELCDCVLPSLQCIAKPNLPATNISSLFGLICGTLHQDCSGINANGTYPGQYGAFSPCDATVKLSWLMNEYYISQNKVAEACNFGGQAATQSAQTPSGTCPQLLNEAGTAGTGTVNSNGGSSASGSKSAASGNLGTIGDFRIMAAILTAFLGGIALVVV